jgi:hypothetical protein
MNYPLRTVLRCIHDGEKLGSVVVVRGDPIYDENNLCVGYKNRFMQIRRGNLKGKECREFFDSLDDWHMSMGIVYPKPTDDTAFCDMMTLLIGASAIFFGSVIMSYHTTYQK